MAPNDELCGILRELPAPSEAMKVAQQTIVRLELIHSPGATAIPGECEWCVVGVGSGHVRCSRSGEWTCEV